MLHVISLILTLILLVPVICGVNEGNWGVVAVCSVLIIFIWGLHCAAVDDAKAYINRREYWANGGPNADKEGHTVSRRNVRIQNNSRTNAEHEAERERLRKEVKAEVMAELRKDYAAQERREREDSEAEHVKKLEDMRKRSVMYGNGKKGQRGIMDGYYRGR